MGYTSVVEVPDVGLWRVLYSPLYASQLYSFRGVVRREGHRGHIRQRLSAMSEGYPILMLHGSSTSRMFIGHVAFLIQPPPHRTSSTVLVHVPRKQYSIGTSTGTCKSNNLYQRLYMILYRNSLVVRRNLTMHFVVSATVRVTLSK